MAIYTINEVKQQQTGSWTSKGERNYLRIVQLLSNDAKDDQVVVLEAVCAYLGIPLGVPVVVIYQCGNSIDPFCYLKKITVLQDTGKRGEYVNWIARLEYDSTLDQAPDNPLLEPTQISGSFQIYLKALWLDINGKVPVNSAGQPFNPPLEIDDSRCELKMVRNEASYSIATASAYVNKINLSPWYFGSTGQWKCNGISGQGPNFKNNVLYWVVSYDFQFHQEGWPPQPVNKGLLQKDGTPCVDSNNVKAVEPQFLDAKGKQLPFPANPASITYTTVQGYYYIDFNSLALP